MAGAVVRTRLAGGARPGARPWGEVGAGQSSGKREREKGRGGQANRGQANRGGAGERQYGRATLGSREGGGIERAG